MENGRLLQFRLYKVLNGPVQQAFVYVYNQTYTQDTDVYTYLLENGLMGLFGEAELASLRLERRPRHYRLPLLFEVLRSCCGPSLAPPSSLAWRRRIRTEGELEGAGVEGLLATLAGIYEEACGACEALSREGFEAEVSGIALLLGRLVERAGAFDVSGRWKEDLESIMALLDEICSGERRGTSSSEIAGVLLGLVEFQDYNK